MADLTHLLQQPNSTATLTAPADSSFGDTMQQPIDTPLFRAMRQIQGAGSANTGVTGGSPFSAEDMLPSIPRSKWEALLMALPVLGMVPTKGNLPKFNAKMMEILGKKGPITPAALAESFMETRYPNRMNPANAAPSRYPQPLSITHDPLGEVVGPRAAGQNATTYDPKTGALVRNDIHYRATTANPFGDDAIADMVNTLGHETQHSLQALRQPRWIQHLDSHLPYANQFFEFGSAENPMAGANSAGETAEEAYRKYQALLGAAKKKR